MAVAAHCTGDMVATVDVLPAKNLPWQPCIFKMPQPNDINREHLFWRKMFPIIYVMLGKIVIKTLQNVGIFGIENVHNTLFRFMK